jgi:hypothetical protein
MVQHEMDPMAIMLIFSNHVDSISYTNIICNKRKEDRAFPLRVKTHSFHALRQVKTQGDLINGLIWLALITYFNSHLTGAPHHRQPSQPVTVM